MSVAGYGDGETPSGLDVTVSVLPIDCTIHSDDGDYAASICVGVITYDVDGWSANCDSVCTDAGVIVTDKGGHCYPTVKETV